MRKTAVMGFVTLAVLAAIACSDNPTGPGASLRAVKPLKMSTETGTTETDTTQIDIWYKELAGTWQATKAEGTYHWDPNIRRDLVAEGGKVSLVLDVGQTEQTFTVTLTMPGEAPRVNYGNWYCWNNAGRPQIDFWPGWIPLEDLEYGDGIGMYFALSDNTLTLSDGDGRFLRYDFFDNDPGHLELVLTRSGD
jgi:hypothetical protein